MNMLTPQLTRRDFLRVPASGSLAFALKDLRIDRALADPAIVQGRMTQTGFPLYDAPAFAANKLHILERMRWWMSPL